MNSDALIFAAIFIFALLAVCSGVVMLTFNRVSGASMARSRKRRPYRSAHHASKDVL